MKVRLAAVLAACAAVLTLAVAGCSESQKSMAAVQPPPPAPERVLPDPAPGEALPPPEPGKNPEALASAGEEVKSDAEQIAAFEKPVLK